VFECVRELDEGIFLKGKSVDCSLYFSSSLHEKNINRQHKLWTH
jgi:hypothetical protein